MKKTVLYKFPWEKTFMYIRQRCSYPNDHIYKRYGGRGIKNLITMNELKTLWFRDRAFEMKKPSIDRIDNNGNYTIKNCRYLEFSENVINGNHLRKGTHVDKEKEIIIIPGTRTCLECFKQFEVNLAKGKLHPKCCSKKCTEINYHKGQVKRLESVKYLKRGLKMEQTETTSQDGLEPEIAEPIVCGNCLTLFKGGPIKRGPRTKYCSEKCRQIVWHKNRIKSLEKT